MDIPSSPARSGPRLDSEALIGFCLTRLRRLASRMLSQYTKSRRQEDTDDLLQNAAVRLHRALKDVTVESTEHAMALAIVQIRRELVDMIRRLRRRPEATALSSVSEPGGPAEQIEGWETFHGLVRGLPDAQREAVHFLWYLGLDQADAAALLGISTRTLRRNWRMARESLRRQLGGPDFLD